MGILKQLESDYDVDIVDEFLTHFSLMSTSLEPLIINLGRAEYFENNVNEIFRIFHNIKSACSFLHLDPLFKFAKLCEDLMEDARGKIAPGARASDEFIDWLLLASDELELYRKDIENDAEYFHIFNSKLVLFPADLIAEK